MQTIMMRRKRAKKISTIHDDDEEEEDYRGNKYKSNENNKDENHEKEEAEEPWHLTWFGVMNPNLFFTFVEDLLIPFNELVAFWLFKYVVFSLYHLLVP